MPNECDEQDELPVVSVAWNAPFRGLPPDGRFEILEIENPTLDLIQHTLRVDMQARESNVSRGAFFF